MDDYPNKVMIHERNPDDINAVRALLEQSFPSDAEAQLVDALRRSGNLSISLVAELAGGIIGMAAFSPVLVKGKTEAAGPGLAPVAVAPQFQKTGIGSRLIREGVCKARAKGYPFIVVLGEPHYYRRFGFEMAAAYSLQSPYPAEYFMVLFLHRAPVHFPGTAYYTKEFDGI